MSKDCCNDDNHEFVGKDICIYCGDIKQILLQTKFYNGKPAKGLNPLVIKSGIDTRENSDYGVSQISSRVLPDKKVMCYKFKHIKEINNLIKCNFHGAILDDEAQFLSKSDVLYLYNITRKKKIPVYCYGLKTDCNGNLFKGSAALLTFADKITEIESICNVCFTNKAQMHIRLINDEIDKGKKSIAIESKNI